MVMKASPLRNDLEVRNYELASSTPVKFTTESKQNYMNIRGQQFWWEAIYNEADRVS